MRKIKNLYIRYTFIENKERRVTCLFAFSISIPSRRSQEWLPSSRMVQFRDTDCPSVTLIIEMELFAIITTTTKYWTKVSKYILNLPRHYSPQISSLLTWMGQNFFLLYYILDTNLKDEIIFGWQRFNLPGSNKKNPNSHGNSQLFSSRKMKFKEVKHELLDSESFFILKV